MGWASSSRFISNVPKVPQIFPNTIFFKDGLSRLIPKKSKKVSFPKDKCPCELWLTASGARRLWGYSTCRAPQVDGLARIPGLTQALHKSHPQPLNSVPRYHVWPICQALTLKAVRVDEKGTSPLKSTHAQPVERQTLGEREIECLLYDSHQKGEMMIMKILGSQVDSPVAEGKRREGGGWETYIKTHSDRQCQLKKDMVQNTVWLDEGEEEESWVTQEARAEMGGVEEEKGETRGQEADEEKMEKAGERGEEKRKGDAPQGSRVTNAERV